MDICITDRRCGIVRPSFDNSRDRITCYGQPSKFPRPRKAVTHNGLPDDLDHRGSDVCGAVLRATAGVYAPWSRPSCSEHTDLAKLGCITIFPPPILSAMSSDCFKCHLDWDRPLMSCSKCKTARYCSKECQIGHWPIHKPMCKPYDPQKVWGVKFLCKGDLAKIKEPHAENAFIQHVLLDDSHPIFQWGDLCPVTSLCGIPLLIYSLVFHGRMGYRSAEEESAGQNQPAVYLRVESGDGLAPLQWQISNPETCIPARQDRSPLTRETAETVWKWHAKLMNCFGYPSSAGWAPTQRLMTPACFQLFSRDYYEAQKEKGRIGFDPFFKPL